MRQPAGEARHRIAVARLGEAQPGEQRRRARPRAVAADRLEAVMQIGKRRAVVASSAAASARFDFAQLAVAVEHVVDRAVAHRRRLLRDVRDVQEAAVDAAASGRSKGRSEGELAPQRAARRVVETSWRIAANRLDLPPPLAPTRPTCARRAR